LCLSILGLGGLGWVLDVRFGGEMGGRGREDGMGLGLG